MIFIDDDGNVAFLHLVALNNFAINSEAQFSAQNKCIFPFQFFFLNLFRDCRHLLQINTYLTQIMALSNERSLILFRR